MNIFLSLAISIGAILYIITVTISSALPFALASCSTNPLNTLSLGSDNDLCILHTIYKTCLSNASLLNFIKIMLYFLFIVIILDVCPYIFHHIHNHKISTTIFLPLSDDIAAAIAEYVSEPEEVTTLVVNDELLPPTMFHMKKQCNIKICVSSGVYFISGLNILKNSQQVIIPYLVCGYTYYHLSHNDCVRGNHIQQALEMYL